MKLTQIALSEEQQLIQLILSGANIKRLDEWGQLNEVDWKKLARTAAVAGAVGMSATPDTAAGQFAGAASVDPEFAAWFRVIAQQPKQVRDSAIKRSPEQVMRDVGVNPSVKQVLKDPKELATQLGLILVAGALEKAFEHNGQKWVEVDMKQQTPDGAQLLDHPKTGQPVIAWRHQNVIAWKPYVQ